MGPTWRVDRRSILEHNPPSLSTVLCTTTPVLDRVLEKCLAKNPDERWQTATDLRDELKWITQQGEQAATERVSGRRRYTGWLVAGSLFAVLLTWTSVQLGQKRPPARAIRLSVVPSRKDIAGFHIHRWTDSSGYHFAGWLPARLRRFVPGGSAFDLGARAGLSGCPATARD
jgi:serine/threonine protein kinase